MSTQTPKVKKNILAKIALSKLDSEVVACWKHLEEPSSLESKESVASALKIAKKIQAKAEELTQAIEGPEEWERLGDQPKEPTKTPEPSLPETPTNQTAPEQPPQQAPPPPQKSKEKPKKRSKKRSQGTIKLGKRKLRKIVLYKFFGFLVLIGLAILFINMQCHIIWSIKQNKESIEHERYMRSSAADTARFYRLDGLQRENYKLQKQNERKFRRRIRKLENKVYLLTRYITDSEEGAPDAASKDHRRDPKYSSYVNRNCSWGSCNLGGKNINHSSHNTKKVHTGCIPPSTIKIINRRHRRRETSQNWNIHACKNLEKFQKFAKMPSKLKTALFDLPQLDEIQTQKLRIKYSLDPYHTPILTGQGTVYLGDLKNGKPDGLG